MPLFLKNKAETPPGYWRFVRYSPDRPDLPDEQRYIYGGDFPDLVKKVVDFRILNGIPLGNPEEEIQDWICRTTGARCRAAEPSIPRQGIKASGILVARFLRAMASWLVNGGHVDQAEANRRAEICSGCVWNVRMSDEGCLGCFGLASRVMQVVGQRTTPLDDTLQFCGRCGCSLKIVPWVPLNVLDRAHTNEDFKGIDTNGHGTPCWRSE